MTAEYSFPDPERDVLDALLDTLIPPDDWPGGREAGCGTYIARQLAGDRRQDVALVTGGLAGLDAEARARHGSGFAALAPERRTALVEAAEAGTVQAPWSVAPVEFVRAMVELAAEGYYADPGNGGNRGKKSWAMIGYPDRPRG